MHRIQRGEAGAGIEPAILLRRTVGGLARSLGNWPRAVNLVTTEPNAVTQPVHDRRMIVKSKRGEEWDRTIRWNRKSGFRRRKKHDGGPEPDLPLTPTESLVRFLSQCP